MTPQAVDEPAHNHAHSHAHDQAHDHEEGHAHDAHRQTNSHAHAHADQHAAPPESLRQHTSLLMNGAAQRVLGALVLVAVLWLAVAWAVRS